MSEKQADDVVMVPRVALDWLFGVAPDGDGNWFGDTAPEPDEKPYRRYWWRSKFRSMIPALSQSNGTSK